mmetsp:Transcript_2630/g.10264  ORF Transcript_2630/g.10264 Transcript_2630/m.10264 type:complete len:202 (+) Transcript_2630:2855-3460(+)
MRRRLRRRQERPLQRLRVPAAADARARPPRRRDDSDPSRRLRRRPPGRRHPAHPLQRTAAAPPRRRRGSRPGAAPAAARRPRARVSVPSVPGPAVPGRARRAQRRLCRVEIVIHLDDRQPRHQTGAATGGHHRAERVGSEVRGRVARAPHLRCRERRGEDAAETGAGKVRGGVAAAKPGHVGHHDEVTAAADDAGDERGGP